MLYKCLIDFKSYVGLKICYYACVHHNISNSKEIINYHEICGFMLTSD